MVGKGKWNGGLCLVKTRVYWSWRLEVRVETDGRADFLHGRHCWGESNWNDGECHAMLWVYWVLAMANGHAPCQRKIKYAQQKSILLH
jgi:hypothetical protein